MAEQRVSLREAGELLEISPDTVRYRFRQGEIRGERDNQGKIWVFIDPDTLPGRKAASGRKSKDSQPGNEEPSNLEIQPGNSIEIETMRDLLEAVSERLKDTQDRLKETQEERDRLRTLADELPIRLAEVVALKERLSGVEMSAQNERQTAAELIADLRRRVETEAAGRAAEATERQTLTAALIEATKPQPIDPNAGRGLWGWIRPRKSDRSAA